MQDFRHSDVSPSLARPWLYSQLYSSYSKSTNIFLAILSEKETLSPPIYIYQKTVDPTWDIHAHMLILGLRESDTLKCHYFPFRDWAVRVIWQTFPTNHIELGWVVFQKEKVSDRSFRLSDKNVHIAISILDVSDLGKLDVA